MATNPVTPVNLFEVLRTRPIDPQSAKFPITCPRGFAMGQKLDDPDSFVPATGTNFIGHVTRDVTTDGPTLEDRVFGRTSTTPVPLNEPFKAGNEVTVRQHEEIEVEGTDLVQTSGTGGITAITTPGTKLSLNAGRFYQAQTGDHVFYLLTANNLPDTTGGTTRIRVQRT